MYSNHICQVTSICLKSREPVQGSTVQIESDIFILHLLIYIKIQNHAEEYDALQKRSFITYEKLYKAVENRKI